MLRLRARLVGVLLCSFSALFLADPASARPPVPVIFIHGIASDATAWQSFGERLEQNGWSFGGCPAFGRLLEVVVNVCSEFPTLSPGDFYRVQFSNNQKLTFAEQAEELDAIIEAVLAVNPAMTKVILVGHSMGGLAARSYLQFRLRGDTVLALITVGTSHGGLELAVICQEPPFLCGIVLEPGSIAVAELRPDSSAMLNLNDLRNHPLPSSVSYTSIIGTGTQVIGSPGWPLNGEDGDGIVTAVSQNLGSIAGSGELDHTAAPVRIEDCSIFPQTHTCETSDTSVWTEILGAIHTSRPRGALASGLSVPNFIAVDESHVYWTEFASSGPINRVPLNGGPVTLVNAGTGAGGTGIAVDSASVYWASTSGGGGGAISRAPKSGGALTFLASANQPYDLAVDSSYVFWAEANGGSFGSNAIRKVPIDGGSVITVDTGGTLHGVMAIDATNVYYRYNDGFVYKLAKVSKDGGTVIDLVSGLAGPPTGIAVDASSVYWVEQNSGTLSKVPIAGGSVVVLASGHTNPMRVTVDSSYVYLTEAGTGPGQGAVKRVPLAGGPTVPLASGLNNPMGIVTDTSAIYWTEQGTNSTDGAVRKLLK